MKIFTFSEFAETFPLLFPYIGITLLIVAVTMVISFVLAIGLAACKLGKNRFLRTIAYGYTEIIQGTPFLVLLFVVFYGLPILFECFGVDLYNWDKAYFLLIALVLFSTSRLSETFRSAYETVDPFQMEAAVSVGLSGPQAMLRVIFPQAFYIALPNIGNVIISALLETSLGFTIGQIDILGQAKLINARSYGMYTIEVFMATAVVYWILTMIIARVTQLCERAFAKRMGISYAKKRKGGEQTV